MNMKATLSLSVFAASILFSTAIAPEALAAGQFAGNPAPAYRPLQVASQSSQIGNMLALLEKMNQSIEGLSAKVGQIQAAPRKVALKSLPSAKRGKVLFHEMQCISCHGVNGKGHEAKTNMKDERKLPIMAADLTQPSSFGNGNARKDIFRTVMTGLNGSPMPSFEDYFADDQDKLWDLVEYVYSLQEDTLARFLP